MVAPVMVLWRPTDAHHNQSTSTDIHSLPEDTNRQLWIWVHPAAFDESYELISASATRVSSTAIRIRDARHDYVAFDFAGPRSHGFIHAVLNVCNDDDDDSAAAAQHWAALATLRTSASLSPGVVLGLTVLDPRLR